MTLVASAQNAAFHGWDVDLTIAVHNQSFRPATVTFLRALTRRGDQGFRCELLPDQRGVDEDEGQLCASHWLPWHSSASHVLRIFEAGFLPESVALVVTVGGKQHVLDVDLTPAQMTSSQI